MVHSLCSAYHWDYEQVLRRTVPQIIMMNYEAWAESDRWEKKRERDSVRKDRRDKHNPVVDGNGNRLEDVLSDPMREQIYMKSLGDGLGSF